MEDQTSTIDVTAMRTRGRPKGARAGKSSRSQTLLKTFRPEKRVFDYIAAKAVELNRAENEIINFMLCCSMQRQDAMFMPPPEPKEIIKARKALAQLDARWAESFDEYVAKIRKREGLIPKRRIHQKRPKPE